MPESCGSKAFLFHHDMSVQYEPKRFRIWAKLCKPVQIYVMQKLNVVLKTKPPLKGQQFRTTSTLIMYSFFDDSNSIHARRFLKRITITLVYVWLMYGAVQNLSSQRTDFDIISGRLDGTENHAL